MFKELSQNIAICLETRYLINLPYNEDWRYNRGALLEWTYMLDSALVTTNQIGWTKRTIFWIFGGKLYTSFLTSMWSGCYLYQRQMDTAESAFYFCPMTNNKGSIPLFWVNNLPDCLGKGKIQSETSPWGTIRIWRRLDDLNIFQYFPGTIGFFDVLWVV